MNAVPPRITVVSSREFNQDTAKAKRAANHGPVFITTRGQPTHVLITKAEYDRARGETQPVEVAKSKPFVSLADVLADPRPEADFEFEFPEFKGAFKGFEFE